MINISIFLERTSVFQYIKLLSLTLLNIKEIQNITRLRCGDNVENYNPVSSYFQRNRRGSL